MSTSVYHITSWFDFSNQIDCNNLAGPIALDVIFKLTPGVKFGGKNCFEVLSTLSHTSTWGLHFFQACNI